MVTPGFWPLQGIPLPFLWSHPLLWCTGSYHVPSFCSFTSMELVLILSVVELVHNQHHGYDSMNTVVVALSCFFY